MSTDLERLTPEWIGPIANGRGHRYALYRSVVAGQDVVDVACGEGYRTSRLAQRARPQAGVDVEEDTIRHATKKHQGNTRLKYSAAASESSPINRVS